MWAHRAWLPRFSEQRALTAVGADIGSTEGSFFHERRSQKYERKGASRGVETTRRNRQNR